MQLDKQWWDDCWEPYAPWKWSQVPGRGKGRDACNAHGFCPKRISLQGKTSPTRWPAKKVKSDQTTRLNTTRYSLHQVLIGMKTWNSENNHNNHAGFLNHRGTYGNSLQKSKRRAVAMNALTKQCVPFACGEEMIEECSPEPRTGLWLFFDWSAPRASWFVSCRVRAVFRVGPGLRLTRIYCVLFRVAY